MNDELTPQQNPTYSTLEEIRLRKEQLSDALERDGEQIGNLWNQLFIKREDSTKGEYIASLVANSITAIDAFIMVRKLIRNYGSIANLLTGKRTKKKSKK